MPVAESGVNFAVAPSDYAELHRNYYEYVVRLVGRLGITPEDREDVASEILTRFFERDFLHEFDPTMVFEYEGQVRPARFKSFLSSFVATYVQSYRDRQIKKWQRELLLVDHPSICEGDTNFLDSYAADRAVHDQSGVDEQMFIAFIRTRLALVPRRSKKDICDLVALFDAVITQIFYTGKYNVRELQDIFGISSTAVHSWLGWLRLNIKKITDGEQ